MIRKSILILLCVLLLTSVSGCRQKISDSLKFKKEYEALNGKKDDSNVSYLPIEISKDNTVRYCDYDKAIEALENGTHLVYLGWPGCPWCRSMLPVLIEEVNKVQGVYIYYCNILSLREAFENDPQSSSGRQYKRFADLLEEYAGSKYEDGTAKLTASNVYFVREGEIIAVHNRTVESHLDPYEPLMDYQKQQLAEQFGKLLEELTKDIPIGCLDC